MPFNFQGEWEEDPYDNDPNRPKSPYEQAHGSGQGAQFDQATNEYYGFGGGSPVEQKPGTNWYDPSSYQYLINTPGAQTAGDPQPPTPPSSPNGPGGPSGGGDPYVNPGAPGFQWPMPQLPVFDPGSPFAAPPPFSYPDFSYESYSAPTLEEARNEPGYAFSREEGIKALENSKAARGILRTGGTLKDILGWGNRFAEQNYSNVENRKRGIYSTNRGNAFGSWDANRTNAAENYMTNYGVSRDTFNTNYGMRRDKHEFDYQGAQGMFQPQQRAAELTFDDLYRRWRDQLNSTTSIATAGAGL